MDVESVNGYVRPLVTLAFTSCFCYLAIMGTITPDVFVPTVTMVIGFWFRARDDAKEDKQVINQIKTLKEKTK